MSKISKGMTGYLEMGDRVFNTKLWRYWSHMPQEVAHVRGAEARDAIAEDLDALKIFDELSEDKRRVIVKLFAASLDRSSSEPSVDFEVIEVQGWTEMARSRRIERKRSIQPWPITQHDVNAYERIIENRVKRILASKK